MTDASAVAVAAGVSAGVSVIVSWYYPMWRLKYGPIPLKTRVGITLGVIAPAELLDRVDSDESESREYVCHCGRSYQRRERARDHAASEHDAPREGTGWERVYKEVPDA